MTAKKICLVVLLGGLAAGGIKLSVLSNKPDGFTREMVAHFLGEFDFEIVRGAMDGVPLKPDPSSALRIAADMGLSPERILYLGDTGTDMKTAVGAGMYAVGCTWGFRAADELIANGADAIISHPSELPGLI